MSSDAIAEINLGRLFKGQCIVNPGEHVTVDDAWKTIFIVRKGGKLTLHYGKECTINSEEGAEVKQG